MSYCKVIKVSVVNGSIDYTTIGYINSGDKSSFETIQGLAFPQWVNDNPNSDLEVYFDTNDPCYLLDTANDINGLSLIANFENPEA